MSYRNSFIMATNKRGFEVFTAVNLASFFCFQKARIFDKKGCLTQSFRRDSATQDSEMDDQGCTKHQEMVAMLWKFPQR